MDPAETRSDYMYRFVSPVADAGPVTTCVSTVDTPPDVPRFEVWAPLVPVVWRTKGVREYTSVLRTVTAGAGTTMVVPTVVPPPAQELSNALVAVVASLAILLLMQVLAGAVLLRWRRGQRRVGGAATGIAVMMVEIPGTALCEVDAKTKAPRAELES